MASKYEKFDDGDPESGLTGGGEEEKRPSVPTLEVEQLTLRTAVEPRLQTQPSRSLRTNSEALDNAINAVGSLESSTNSNGSKTEYNSFPSYATSPDELSFQEKFRNFLEHLFFRFFSLIVILIDCTILVIDIATNKSPQEQAVYDFFAITFLLYFCLELSARIYSQGYVVEMFKLLVHFCLQLFSTCLSVYLPASRHSLPSGTTHWIAASLSSRFS